MASPPNLEDPTQIKHRARVRIGIAIALLAISIAILAVLNQRGSEPKAGNVTPDAMETITSTEVEMSSSATQPTPNSISSPPPPSDAETLLEPPPPPVTGNLPPAAEATPAEPSARPDVVELTASPRLAPQPTPAPTPQPSGPAHVAAPGPAASPPATVAAPRNYQVQVGVFSDPENARQLQIKLAEQGIPSHLETRLQVGPFKTQAEAVAAKAKLKALGINAVIAH